jgi:hypothetical protein
MVLYKLIGILRCPYRGNCLSGANEQDDDRGTLPPDALCFTRRHVTCPIYQTIEKEEQKRIEVARSIINDAFL